MWMFYVVMLVVSCWDFDFVVSLVDVGVLCRLFDLCFL